MRTSDWGGGARVGLSYPNLKSTQVSNFFVRRSNGADDRFEPLKLGSPHKISKFSRVRGRGGGEVHIW